MILLSGHFNASYGEISQRMSGYPLMVGAEIEKTASNLEKLPSIHKIRNSQNASHFSRQGTGKAIPTGQKGSPNPDKLTKIPPVRSLPGEQNVSSVDSEESVYLAVYLNNQMLTEVLEAKEKGGAVYFKLREIALLIDSAQPEDLNAIATSDALEEIYPAKFNYSQRYQALIIEGDGKLPIEKKWKRERLQKMLGNNSITEDTPLVNFDYGLLGPPSFDLSASYLKSGHETFNYSFKGGMEALYGTATIFGRGFDSDELTDLRVSWERLNSDWFVQLGDVFAPPIELVAQAEAGRGINFSTFPIENATQFDTDTITGDLGGRAL